MARKRGLYACRQRISAVAIEFIVTARAPFCIWLGLISGVHRLVLSELAGLVGAVVGVCVL
jgi:hypothetical protein